MDYITLEEFQKLEEYQNFIRENPDVGVLKIQVFTAGGAIPLSNTNILVMKEVGDYNVLFFNGVTDALGVIDNIVLPTPERVVNNTDLPKYTFYEVSAIHTGYQDIRQYMISMFGGIKVIQYIRLAPEVIRSV